MDGERLKILVALDGSPESESIFSAIMPLVRSRPCEVVLVRAFDGSEGYFFVKAYLARAKKALEAHGIDAAVRVKVGPAAGEILATARQSRSDFIAMTTHGRTGLRRVFLGSVTEEVLRHSDVPLIVNRPDSKAGDWTRIVVALDGSTLAEGVLPDAAKIARATDATLLLAHAKLPLLVERVEPQLYLDDVCRRLDIQGVKALGAEREGEAGRAIVGYAQEIGPGLIVMTTHGRTGLNRALAGSVAEEILRTAPCPVLVRRMLEVPAPIESAP